MKTAIIAGASGLTGAALLTQLLADADYSSVIILVRNKLPITHTKLTQIVVDFSTLENYSQQIKGDVFFSCLGTTLAKAGSKEAQYLLEYTQALQLAEIAAKNGVPVYVLISSLGANENSRWFYFRMKGKLDKDVSALPFNSINIVRPGMLGGVRPTDSFFAKFIQTLMKPFAALGLMGQSKLIPVATLANSMRKLAKEAKAGVTIMEGLELFGKY